MQNQVYKIRPHLWKHYDTQQKQSIS